MKPILIYLLLSVSLVVFAQQPTEEEMAQEADTEQISDEFLEEENEPTLAELPENEDELTVEVEQQAEEQEDEEVSEDTAPSDKDFKPSEEISEDYPVPLPSDI